MNFMMLNYLQSVFVEVIFKRDVGLQIEIVVLYVFIFGVDIFCLKWFELVYGNIELRFYIFIEVDDCSIVNFILVNVWIVIKFQNML